MKRFANLASLILFITLATAADVNAGDTNCAIYNGRNTIYDVPIATAGAPGDTIYLLGGPDREDGDFELNGQPNWDGWTHADMTSNEIPRWQVSSWNNPGTGNGVWCGGFFAPCVPFDMVWGYGNQWREWLDFYGTAPDPAASTTVRVQALMNYDTESVEDFVYLELEGDGLMYIMGHWSGSNKDGANVFTPVEVDEWFTVETYEYVGSNHDQIHLRWEFISDDTGSDEDCLYPTYGACTIDNIIVSFNDVVASSTDFEDGTLGDWRIVYATPVGDFSKVWPSLNDFDRCVDNNTPQVAFIDDGIVVPGTGGTAGVTWIYGPGSYVVNLNGGLAGPGNLLHNRIMSPIMAWPAGYAGASLGFDAYMHLPYENRLFTQWWLSTSADGGATWQIRNDQWLWYDDAHYRRFEIPVAVYAIPGANKAQVCLDVMQLEPLDKPLDPTPAPYFDNVCFKVYPLHGPAMAVPGYAHFQDNFPEVGIIDDEILGNDWVRLDIAANISPPGHLRNDPGDSTVCDVVPARVGSVLIWPPTLHVRMKVNPLYDAVRCLPPFGFVRVGNLIDGVVTGSQDPRPDRYFFDLPDTCFFYPGDVIHYYFRGQDIWADSIVGVAMVPPDTTGFSLFPGMAGYVPMRFDMDFIVRALPSMTGTKVADQPKILFWNDATGYGGDDEWLMSLGQLGYREGHDFDMYVTKAPAAGLGNGLGGRAKPAQVAGYRTMLYTSGVLRDFTISNGDFYFDAGNDVELMRQWCYGSKNLFATGDNLAEDLAKSGVNCNLFMSDFMQIGLLNKDIRPLIGNQTSPTVVPIAGNVVGLIDWYFAYGGCPRPNDFDAVGPANGGVRIAEFLDAGGQPGMFPFSAATLGVEAWSGTRVISMPYDFQFIFDIPGQNGPDPLPVRTRVLSKIMLYFGEIPGGPAVDVPGALALGARSYPNPFNPATKIAYTLPRPGELAIRIFNVRGELVRTLFDGCVTECEGSVDWDGADDGGRSVASGAYFYQVKTDGGELFNKVMLLK